MAPCGAGGCSGGGGMEAMFAKFKEMMAKKGGGGEEAAEAKGAKKTGKKAAPKKGKAPAKNGKKSAPPKQTNKTTSTKGSEKPSSEELQKFLAKLAEKDGSDKESGVSPELLNSLKGMLG